MKYLSIFSTLLISLLISGCTSAIVSDVTRFHQLAPANGNTVEIVSLDPALQKSIEFGQYAEMIGSELGKQGYRAQTDGGSALTAQITYGARLVAVMDDASGSQVSVGMGGGSRGSSVGIGISTSLGSSEPKRDFVRFLTLDIVRRADGARLYEGRVESRGPENSLPYIMPFLVNALFEDFPGESGESNRVKASR